VHVEEQRPQRAVEDEPAVAVRERDGVTADELRNARVAELPRSPGMTNSRIHESLGESIAWSARYPLITVAAPIRAVVELRSHSVRTTRRRMGEVYAEGNDWHRRR